MFFPRKGIFQLEEHEVLRQLKKCHFLERLSIPFLRLRPKEKDILEYHIDNKHNPRHHDTQQAQNPQ